MEGTPLNPASMGFALPQTKLNAWFPNNEVFWKNEGKLIAWRNLVVSVPNLLLGFAIWVCVSLCDCMCNLHWRGCESVRSYS